MKTVDFSETIEACDLKVGICRQLIKLGKVWKVKVISEKILVDYFQYLDPDIM